MLNFLTNGFKSSSNTIRPRVLVVEDDLSLVEVLESLFEISGVDFNIYQDVHDIKSLVVRHQPSLILLDYLLPSTNGGELCHQLKVDPETTTIPVIIYSAISKQLLPLKEYQCDCFIEKPFDLDYLLQKINYYSKKVARH